LIKDGQLIGLLDVDSPALARFDGEDAQGLNELAEIFVKATEEV
jgi:GAF domain-containing protein